MTIRTRTRVVPLTGHTYWYDFDGVTVVWTETATISALDQYTVDVPDDYGGNHAFTSILTLRDVVPVNGVVNWLTTPPRKRYEAVGWPSGPSVALDSSLALRLPAGSTLAARMSPNKPIVDLPLFLFELKDLPGMLRHAQSFGASLPWAIRSIKNAGDFLLSNKSSTAIPQFLGETLLTWKFGWEPLISDLLSMTGLALAVERRKKQLKNLMGEKGLRRRVNVDSANVQTISSDNELMDSGIFALRGRVTTTTQAERWATTRWKSTARPPTTSREEDWNAIRTLLGLSISPALLWSALPFSWMSDWFSNTGDWLEVSRNTIPCYVESGSLMTKRSTSVHWSVRSRIGWSGTGGGGTAKVTRKEREVLSITPFASAIPFLGGGQLSILASLQVAKLKSWRLT